MKLPEEGAEPGSKDYDLAPYIRHNEQIAAQLTISYKNTNHTSDSDETIIETVSRIYKIFLDKLNRGEL